MSEYILIFLLFNYISNFYALHFETILIRDKEINETNYHSNITQNELYVNLSVGTPQQQYKSVLKGDKYGFIIYENALNFDELDSSEKVIDDKIRVEWGLDYDIFPLKDNFYLPSYNSYSVFNKSKNNKLFNITKTNKALFLQFKQKKGTSYYFNEMFKNYGIIGLKFNDNPYYKCPDLVPVLKELKEINSYAFSLKFENDLINGFADNNNRGYLIIGEDLTDIEEEKEKIKYVNAVFYRGEVSWNLNFDNINTGKIDEYNEEDTIVGIMASYPYMIGSVKYFTYLNKTFFNTVIGKKYCKVHLFKKHGKYSFDDYYSFACDSKSEEFMDFLNNSFPDLIFEHKELEMNFTLTKNDLFAYNSFDNLDTNLYFLMINGLRGWTNYWHLGIPFLKKYRLSFNYDTRLIGYYINDGKPIEKKEKEGFNFFKSIYFKIIIIVVLVVIIFILGMLFQKKFRQSRKKKANELDDDNFEYEPYKEQNKDNVNINNIINTNDNDVDNMDIN